jgi:thymidylate synthase (FAD)
MPKIFSKFGKDKQIQAETQVLNALMYLEQVQKNFMDIFQDEMKDFETKKQLTSAFRRVAPDGLATGIMSTFNFRELRHILTMRTSKHAEEEIRLVFNQVAEILIKDFPMVFGDFQKVDTGDGLFEYVPTYEKV